MSPFAVNGDKHLRPDPFVHRGQFGSPWVARNMHMRLLFCDHDHILARKGILDPTNGDFIARNLLRRKYDRIAFSDLDLMLVECNPRERCAVFTLPACSDDETFVSRQCHRGFEIDSLGEILQITVLSRRSDDPIK